MAGDANALPHGSCVTAAAGAGVLPGRGFGQAETRCGVVLLTIALTVVTTSLSRRIPTI